MAFLTTDANLGVRQRLGVGRFENSTYRGPLYYNDAGILSYNQSSERFKENIQTVTDCSWVYELRPVTFSWKNPERTRTEGPNQLGLIAEEAYAQCPQLAWLDKEGTPEGVHYEWLALPLIVELKKLHTRITNIENKLLTTIETPKLEVDDDGK
jgi:hypothetical protein